MTNIKKNVCVIGAGPSGLVTIKEMLEQGHSVVCFEKEKNLGGVYLYRETGLGTYKSMKLTSSSHITCFSDFPIANDAPPHFRHNQYLKYLTDYANNFKIFDHIRFGQSIEHVEQLSNQQWKVTVKDLTRNTSEELVFDALAVCSGAHQTPAIPRFANQGHFKGQIIHSAQYKEAGPFKGKRVLVVGAGESGSDIIEEVSAVTKESAVSVRRGALILPRMIVASPNDYYTNRLFYMLPDWLLRIRHKKLHKPSVLLLILTWGVFSVFFSFLNLILVFIADKSAFLDFFIFSLVLLFSVYICFRFIKYIFSDVTPKVFNVMGRLMRNSNAGHGEQFATKSEGIARAVANNKSVLKPQISSFEENGVVFEDGSKFEADTVIFCTGYKLTFPFLKMEELDSRSLYKNCFHTDYGSTLCFIGLARPAIGSVPPISELQARWFSRILSEDCVLPGKEEMEREIEADAAAHKNNFKVVSERLTGLVNFTYYMDEIAGFIGCKPKWKDLVKSPSLLLRVYFNPFLSCQYRLYGPASNKELAVKMMKQVPIEPIRAVYCLGLMLINSISFILFNLGFRSFKLNLRLWDDKK